MRVVVRTVLLITLIASLPPAFAIARRLRPTRADLSAARTQVALLEAEYALDATRKPYLVLDLPGRSLHYRLAGMALRDIPLPDATAHGMTRAEGGTTADAPALAGILPLAEKEGDPRLAPLTPEQIEAGLDDENVADALPPDPPARYALTLGQGVVVRVDGLRSGAITTMTGAGAALRRAWRALVRIVSPGAAGGGPGVEITMDATTARELYRSLVPGERVILVPAAGSILPPVGQERPRAIRPARPAPRPTPLPAPPAGIPFQIPPPVPIEERPAGGEPVPPSAASPPLPPAPSPAPTPSTDRPPQAAPSAAPEPPGAAAPQPSPSPGVSDVSSPPATAAGTDPAAP
jgi:hypothetical protein